MEMNPLWSELITRVKNWLEIIPACKRKVNTSLPAAGCWTFGAACSPFWYVLGTRH